MDYMSIASMSVGMHQQQNSVQLGTAVLKMAMEASSESMTDLLDAIDVSAMTGVGGNVDILV